MLFTSTFGLRICTAILLGALATGCTTPVGVRRAKPDEIYAGLTANVLSRGRLSAPTAQLLYRLDLPERFRKAPAETIAEIHSGLGGPDHQLRLPALAELSFAHAENGGPQSYYLASAVYAYAYLLPDPGRNSPTAYDPTFRLAIDLYNRGLVSGMASEDGETVDVSPRTIDFPLFEIELVRDESTTPYAGYELYRYVATGDFVVRGLRNRYRRAGVGAALIASVESSGNEAHDKWIPPNSKVPVTAVVKFGRTEESMLGGRVTGVMSLYEDDATASVNLKGQDVPLERETTAALAYGLNDSAIWDFEVAGFRRGDFRDEDDDTLGISMIQPYRPNRIPVVFVHGTASSPARWAEMTNELMAGDIIGTRYQFWYFTYNSGNPVLYSGHRLRSALKAIVADLDPDGNDPALQEMVLIGHSQGGLLVKLMTVSSSGDRFLENISGKTIDELEFSDETGELIRNATHFEPLPFVDTAVFIATPHHGSFVADSWLGRMARRFVSLPGNITRATLEVIQLDADGAANEVGRTSVDNMRSDNPFLLTLADTPIDDRVTAHSIIPVKGDGPIEEGNDGVVEYTSAHIEDVESELVVRSGHSTQSVPATIEEVRRILFMNILEEEGM